MERKMSDEEYLRMTGSFGGMDVDVFDGTFQKPVLVNGEARFDVMDRKGRKMTLQYKKGRIGTTGDDGIVNWFERKASREVAALFLCLDFQGRRGICHCEAFRGDLRGICP